MDEQIICVDAKFTADQLAFWVHWGVTHPLQDVLYTVREIIAKNSEGNSGILLNEINNPKVPIAHPILGTTMIEPYWNVTRFATLGGTPLTMEMVKEWEREYQLTKNLNF